MRPEVTIKVGPGQYDYERALRIRAAERANGAGVAPGVERQQAIGRLTGPALLDPSTVAEVL